MERCIGQDTIRLQDREVDEQRKTSGKSLGKLMRAKWELGEERIRRKGYDGTDEQGEGGEFESVREIREKDQNQVP